MDYLTYNDLGWAKPAVLFFLLVFGLSVLKTGRFRKRPLPLPPGPPGFPIIGNILDIPLEEFWWKYKEWSDQYGSDVIYLNLLGQDVVVLNSLAACKELLEKRSSIYSSRPDMPMLNDFVGFDWHFAFMPYGDEWKGSDPHDSFPSSVLTMVGFLERRKVFMHAFGAHKVEQFRPQLLQHTRNFLLQLLEDPEHFREHSRLLAGAFILDITYGLEVKSPEDVYITQAEQGMHAMSKAGTAASYAVDFLPSLKYLPSWFPGVEFKRDAKMWRPYVEGMAREPFKFVEEGLKRGSARSCVATELLQELSESDPEYKNKRTLVHDVLAAVYAAGSDTTVSTVTTFLLAMAQNPEIQKKAQKVVDEVVNTYGSLPDFTVYHKLPYIEAIVREVLRWRPVAPVGVAHTVIQDDVYNGYHIPRGTTIIPNCIVITHDPAVYGPNTGIFDPSRFLGSTQTKINKEAPMGLEGFGFGRRVCPGMEIAIQSVWLVVVSVLAAFDISKTNEEDEGFGAYSSGLIIHPNPFKINIVPRSKEAEALIKSGVQLS